MHLLEKKLFLVEVHVLTHLVTYVTHERKKSQRAFTPEFSQRTILSEFTVTAHTSGD